MAWHHTGKESFAACKLPASTIASTECGRAGLATSSRLQGSARLGSALRGSAKLVKEHLNKALLCRRGGQATLSFMSCATGLRQSFFLGSTTGASVGERNFSPRRVLPHYVS